MVSQLALLCLFAVLAPAASSAFVGQAATLRVQGLRHASSCRPIRLAPTFAARPVPSFRRLAASSATMQAVVPSKLSELPLREYINAEGKVSFDPAEGSVAVYAIYDKDKSLRFVGQSRYVANSLRIHLGRCPSECYYFRIQVVAKPSRTILDEIKQAWYTEETPSDNDGGARQERWEGAINVQKHVELSAEEKKLLADMSSDTTISTLRNICRRVQQDIEDVLKARGVSEKLQFAPKLKEQGLLDIATVKVAGVDIIGGDTKLDASIVEPKKGGKLPKGAAPPS